MIKSAKKHSSDDDALPAILTLIRQSFAYMDGRIDPPSSMHRLKLEDIARQCERGEVWSIGEPAKACMFLTWKADCVYIGKMAVAEDTRGQGLARQLVSIAEERARERGLPRLELETRIELVDNHRTFAALGFVKTEETAHPGFDRTTSITMSKALADQAK